MKSVSKHGNMPKTPVGSRSGDLMQPLPVTTGRDGGGGIGGERSIGLRKCHTNYWNPMIEENQVYDVIRINDVYPHKGIRNILSNIPPPGGAGLLNLNPRWEEPLGRFAANSKPLPAVPPPRLGGTEKQSSGHGDARPGVSGVCGPVFTCDFRGLPGRMTACKSWGVTYGSQTEWHRWPLTVRRSSL